MWTRCPRSSSGTSASKSGRWTSWRTATATRDRCARATRLSRSRPSRTAFAPADHPGVDRIWIRNVPIEGKIESFSVPGWSLSSLAADLKIVPLEPFAVEVKMALRPATKQFPADLLVAAKPDCLKRIELQTRTVTIEIRGPEDLVQEAAQRPAMFVPYVVVSDKDMEPQGK